MRDLGVGSLGLGRWAGVHVRVHMLFFFFAIFVLYVSWLSVQSLGSVYLPWGGAAFLIIFVLGVMVHELGHAYAAVRLEGIVDQIILGPFGNLEPVRIPYEPKRELLAVAAGPLSNLGVCLACIALLTAAGVNNWLGLLHPLAPADLATGSAWVVGLKLTLWSNWLLLLVNLIPAFPFDGGHAVHAGVLAVWPTSRPRQIMSLLVNLSKLAAIGLVVVAWLVRHDSPTPIMPTWLPLVMLSILIFFGSRNEEARTEMAGADGDLFGYDFSQGYTSLERGAEPGTTEHTEPSPLTRWINRRRAAREHRRKKIEQADEGRVDEILARLHAAGMESLTDEDRALLRRVSARYRSRSGEK